jgi:hypothetical protein
MSRITRASLCSAIGNLGWTDVRALLTDGAIDWRVDNYRTAPSSVDLVIAPPAGQAVSVGTIDKTDGPPEATFHVSVTSGWPADASAELSARFAGQGPPVWLHVDVRDQGQFVQMHVPVSGPVAVAWARAQVDLNNPRRAIGCEAR